MMRTYQQKITFWLRWAGWLCLLPASLYLYFFQLVRGSNLAWTLLSAVALVVFFAVYVLTTAKTARWREPRNLLLLGLLAFLFISVIVGIPIFIAYYDCTRMHKS